VDISGLYADFTATGLEYGPLFQGLTRAWRHGATVYAEIALPQDTDTTGYGIHPALLDAALHPAALLAAGADDNPSLRLPFAWSGITLHATGATTLRVRLTSTGDDSMTVTVADPTGAPVATIDTLTLRPLPAGQLASATRKKVDESLFRLDWTEVGAGTEPAPDRVHLRVVIGAEGPGADRIATQIATTPDTASSNTTTPKTTLSATYPDLAALADAVRGGAATPDEVIVLRSAGAGAAVPELTRSAAHEVLAVVQTWLAEEAFAPARLVVVTQGAVAAQPGDTVPAIAESAVWGLLRTAQAEHPGRFVLVDVDGSVNAESGGSLDAALACGEPQVAVRRGKVLAARLAHTDPAGRLAVPGDDALWRLVLNGSGTLDGLSAEPHEAAGQPLVAGQVRIDVRAAGLNFRDALMALGMVTTDTRPVMGEAAGVVLEVAPDVANVAVGDRVTGLMITGIGPLALADHRLVTRIPDRWSFVQAATVPVVFLTAYHGLKDIARIQEGESLLLHAATGGVGMATLQLARHWGVEVFGTASPAKWGVLRGQGLPADHIASSRTLDFEERIRAVTGGHGVDVVLNALAHEFVDASLRLLSKGGRFIEMGKTDIRAADEIAKQYDGVFYQAFDIMDPGPDRVGEVLAALGDLFERGVLEPLPATAFDIRRAPEALRYLSTAQHTGKVVLSLPPRVDPEGTVLITGGTGVLGGHMARHLVGRRGMRHLILTSRQGMEAAGAEALRSELAALGAEVTIAACDTSDRDALAALMTSVPETRPLTMVVHAAGVIDDGVLSALTPERVDTVLRPKVDAAWHLHDLTRGLDLAEFVLFSSAAGTLGTPGQGSYTAANAFLDALAAHRQAQGLPASALGWGLWEQTSAMTGHVERADLARMARSGIRSLSTEDGLALFDAALATGLPVAVLTHLDVRALGGGQVESLPAILRGLVTAPLRGAGSLPGAGAGAADGLVERLAGVSREKQNGMLRSLVRTQVALVLGHSDPDAITDTRAFKEMGFDSLTAVELRNRLNSATGLRLPATVVFDYPTTEAVTEYLRAQLVPATATASEAFLAEVEKFEADLAVGDPGEDSRTRLSERLQGLLRRLNDVDDGSTAESADTVAEQLGAASDDDLFSFIDNEL
jgi:polyketide synthase 12